VICIEREHQRNTHTTRAEGLGERERDHAAERGAREDARATARERGHRIIRLSYLEGNVSAERFYTGFGFTESHREPTGDGIPDSVWVVRDLWADVPASDRSLP
jgi:GNAT superfamily N-acetyltransferase